MKIAMINAKGGTAKTTSAVSLSHAMAIKKQRVLLIDLDPQASASLSLGFRSDALFPSVTDVLMDKFPIQKAIRKTNVEGVSLLTASMDLCNFDIAFATTKGREHLLKNALDPVSKNFNVIMFDCPPMLGLLSVNALTASDRFIVPVTPQYLALEGLSTLMAAIDRIRAGIGCKTALMGILLTQVDRRGKATSEIIDLIRKSYENSVFKTEVRINTRLAEAPSFGKTIFQHDWSAPGAQAYREVAFEVLKIIETGGLT